MKINDLIRKVKKYNPKTDGALLRKAYNFALEAHKSERRASKEPYIIHPFNVAIILADLYLEDKVIAAALLHDVIEDTPVKLEIIKKEFGDEIASLVEGVTNITKISRDKQTFESENLIKMLMASAKDIRIILIKLADRLHNIRTIKYLDEEKQKRIAKLTLDVYAPIAYRLGLYRLKGELEDLSFKVLNKTEYNRIKKELKKYEKEREAILNEIKNRLDKALKEASINANLQGRIKNVYSIYSKLERKNIGLRDVSDLIALRVIVNSIKECYEVLGIVHKIWKPVPGRLKDMIALPKENLYQSIHTILISERGVQFEIQIRTEEMHKIAEEGIAAHWKYKGITSDESFDKRLRWLKEISEWQRSGELKEFVEDLKVDLFGHEIYVFTPKGKVISLPIGSSVLDFAYCVHSSIGDHGIGAKVNGNFVGLRHEIKNGDIIEVLTSKNQKPSREWLKFVKTLKAREKIRKALRLKGEIPTKGLIQNDEEKQKELGSLLHIKGMTNQTVRFAKCCNPLPGDDITALLLNREVVIHKTECESAKERKSLVVKWLSVFDVRVTIEVFCDDRIGLMADLMNTISRTGINVGRAGAKIVGRDKARCFFVINFKNLEQLSDILARIKKVASVKRVSIGI